MDSIPIAPKLLKRFYEALVMLAILGKNRGDRMKEEEICSGHDIRGQRRQFLRHLAYLCDFDKGGDAATAIALQQTPQEVVYLFASNKTPDSKSVATDKTKRFLQDVLSSLKNMKCDSVEEIEAELFAKSVGFSSKRISEYIKILRPELDFVLNDFDESKSDQGMVDRTSGTIEQADSDTRYIFHYLASNHQNEP